MLSLVSDLKRGGFNYEEKSFSDTAVIVIARIGGEGTDLPLDFGDKNEDGTDLHTYTNNSAEYDDFTDGQHYLELNQTEKNMVELVCDNFEHVVVIYNSANAMELGWVDEYEQIIVSSREKLADVESVLDHYGFYRINKGCIVNMKYVDTVLDGNCYVDGEVLPIAGNKKKAFMDRLTEYIGETMK